jgi:predicted RNA-binding protein associated with RNAse of E/G family
MAGNGKPDFEALGKSIDEAKELEAKAKKLRGDVKKELYKYMNAHWGEDSSKFFPTYGDMIIGRERRVSLSLRQDEFLDKISDEARKYITVLVETIDEDKLKVAVNEGLIYPSTVEECTEEKVTMALVHRKDKSE